VTRNGAVQPFRGEQPAHQHISSEDPDQTQQYARESTRAKVNVVIPKIMITSTSRNLLSIIPSTEKMLF